MGKGEREVDEMAEVVQEGEMPPSYYLLLHPLARLNQVEKQALISGLMDLC